MTNHSPVLGWRHLLSSQLPNQRAGFDPLTQPLSNLPLNSAQKPLRKSTLNTTQVHTYFKVCFMLRYSGCLLVTPVRIKLLLVCERWKEVETKLSSLSLYTYLYRPLSWISKCRYPVSLRLLFHQTNNLQK